MPEWIKTVQSPELKGLAESRRWESPERLLESFHNLEKLRGIPQDKLLAVPETNDQPAIEVMWNRLGRPEKPENYTFPKDAEGADQNKWMAETFHKAGLSSTQAKALFDANAARMAALTKAATDKRTGEAGNQVAALKQEWGQAYEQNMALADQALKRFGMTDKSVKPLTDMVGGPAVVKFLAQVAKGMGEANFISGERGSGAPGVMTPAEAKNAIQAKMKDQGFIQKLTAKDGATLAEWERLNRMASPEAS